MGLNNKSEGYSFANSINRNQDKDKNASLVFKHSKIKKNLSSEASLKKIEVVPFLLHTKKYLFEIFTFDITKKFVNPRIKYCCFT